MGRKRRTSNSAQWWAIGLVAVVVAVTGGLVAAALTPKAPPVTAGTMAGTNDYSSYFEPVDDASRAIFVGDSYSAGTGASEPGRRWTSIVATERGWEERNEALGGTGYLVTATVEGCGLEFCPNYREVLQQMNTTAPDVLFIAGGQNDFAAWREDRQAVTDAVWQTYREARTLFPDTRIVAVGPSVIGDVSEEVIGLDAEVQAAAAEVGAEYISLISPDVLSPAMDVGDGGHVNDEGHRAIADRVMTLVG